MGKNVWTSILGKREEQGAKVKVRAYKYKGILKKEFFSIEEAEDYIATLAEKHPDMIFQPFDERRTGEDRRGGNDRRSGTDRRSGEERRRGEDRRTAVLG